MTNINPVLQVGPTEDANTSTNVFFVQLADGAGTTITFPQVSYDDAAGGTDAAMSIAAVRDDALTTLTPVDGDYVPLRTTSTGALWVELATGSASPTQVDDAAFTVATDSGNAVGGIVTADSVDSGDFGAFRMLANRAQVITLEDAAGDGIAIDGSGNMAIDIAAQTLTAVAISGNATANSVTNPVFVETVRNASSQEIHDFDGTDDTGAGVNHDVTAAGGVLLVEQVIVSSSGGYEVQMIVDPTGTNTQVGHLIIPKDGGSFDWCPKLPVEVPDTDVFRVSKDRTKAATYACYSTVVARQL